VQRSTPSAESQQKETPTPEPHSKAAQLPSTIDKTEEEDTLAIPGRTQARGVSGSSSLSTLETVQEISPANTPALGIDGPVDSKLEDGTKVLTEEDNIMDAAFAKTIIANESGSESGGKIDVKMRSTSAAPHVAGPRPNPISAAASKSFGTSSAAVSIDYGSFVHLKYC